MDSISRNINKKIAAGLKNKKPKTKGSANAKSVAQLSKVVQELAKVSFKPPPFARPNSSSKKNKGKSNRVKVGGKSLSPACRKLTLAYTAPFSILAKGSYLPLLPARPSFKTEAFLKFDATIGTGGYGYVMLSPTLCKDMPFGYRTGVTFAGSADDYLTPFATAPLNVGVLNTGVTQFLMPANPYTYAEMYAGVEASDLAARVEGRIVAVGITATYIGQTQSEAGLMYCFTDPDHKPIHNYTVNTLQSRSECEITNNSRKLCSMAAGPISLTETEYGQDGASIGAYSGGPAYITVSPATAVVYPWSVGLNMNGLGVSASGTFANTVVTSGNGFANSNSFGGCPMVVAFSGTAGQKLHFEVILHAEYIGQPTEGRTTPSPVDILGTQRVIAAASGMYAHMAGDRNMSHVAAFNRSLSEQH